MKLVVEADDIVQVRDAVRANVGLELTEAQALELLNDAGFATEYYEFGINDTCTREYLNDIFARKIVGRNWPERREGQEAYAEFKKAFRENAPKKGYVLVR